MDRPAVIFRQLGIPVYLIWDSDKDCKDSDPKDNRNYAMPYLENLKLLGWAKC